MVFNLVTALAANILITECFHVSNGNQRFRILYIF